jgi:hypothetical protein
MATPSALGSGVGVGEGSGVAVDSIDKTGSSDEQPLNTNATPNPLRKTRREIFMSTIVVDYSIERNSRQTKIGKLNFFKKNEKNIPKFSLNSTLSCGMI